MGKNIEMKKQYERPDVQCVGLSIEDTLSTGCKAEYGLGSPCGSDQFNAANLLGS